MGLPVGPVIKNLPPNLFGLPVELNRNRVKVVTRLWFRLEAPESIIPTDQCGAVLI